MIGGWLVAGTSGAQPYPCRCDGRDCGVPFHVGTGGKRYGGCPCAGRVDVLRVALPVGCCARWHRSLVAAGVLR